MTIERVGILGSGIMGSGIAEVVAKNGHEVVLRSRTQSAADKVLASLEKSLNKQVERGKLEAADAKEALTLVCDRDDIAAMLTDINLPGGEDGFALARAVRVIRPDLPVVYASGRYTAAESGKSVDGSRFLAKPFTPSVAADVIRDLIAVDGGGHALPARDAPTNARRAV